MKNYETQRLSLAAFLMAANHATLVSVRRAAGAQNVSFVLSKTPAKNVVDEFFSGAAQVSALRYSEAIHTLKGAIYEELGYGRK